MKNLVLIIVIFIFLQSCKDDVQPEPQTQYSYWKVNGQDFSVNNIEKAIGHARAGLSSHGSTNRFSLDFCLPFLPSSGEWPLGDSLQNIQQNPNYAYVGFYYNNEFFIHSLTQNYVVIASKINNKVRYNLPPSWFVNYYNHSDSVLIEGTFNEP